MSIKSVWFDDVENDKTEDEDELLAEFDVTDMSAACTFGFEAGDIEEFRRVIFVKLPEEANGGSDSTGDVSSG